ncbi:polysaccharide deacetylase family protein [Glutamicibacter endophyticus]|uniref:polysaccharide deacetylase family protein n=1 Tax=Glutamicibacter endophyticus TaxID=1522174 RepID=UPI003AEF68D3
MTDRIARRTRPAVLLAALSLAAGCAAAPTEDPEPTARGEEQSPAPVDCSVARCIALTYDDGPGANTDRLLRILDEHQAPATFFVLGHKVAAGHDTLRTIREQGHQIGAHGFSHTRFTELSDAQLAEELARTNEVIEQATGVKPQIFRPPYGAYDERVAARTPMPLVLWDVGSNDTRDQDPQKLVKTVLAKARPGSIVLMHEHNDSTVRAAAPLIRSLRKAGFTLVRVEDLFADTEMRDGQAYTRREDGSARRG